MRKNILCFIFLFPLFHTISAIGWFKKVIRNRLEQKKCENILDITSQLHDAIILNNKNKFGYYIKKGARCDGLIDGYHVRELLDNEDLRLFLFQPLVYQELMKERDSDAECEVFREIDL